MKKLLLFTMLISWFVGTGYLLHNVYADDDRYEKLGKDDDRYEKHEMGDKHGRHEINDYRHKKHKMDNNRYKKYEINDDRYEKHEMDDDRFEKCKRVDYRHEKYEMDDDRFERGVPKNYEGNNIQKEQEREKLEAKKQNLTQEKKQYKYLSASVQEKLNNIIQVKLFDRIKNLPINKQILTLDTIVSKIDSLVEKIKSQTNLTTNDYVKLDILEYLKDEVLTYKINLQDPTTDIINSIFWN